MDGELVGRLRRCTYTLGATGKEDPRPINPDGPEAADEIERITKANERLGELAFKHLARAEAAEQRGRELLGLPAWLESVAAADLDEIVADGGITAGMVIQQEARTVWLPRARAALRGGGGE